MFLGTAVPEILIMTLGAVVGTFVLKIGTGPAACCRSPTPSAIPSWFVVVFLIFAIVQIFGINSLDMYSSGVTLQAIGVPVKRYQAVLIDCVIAFGVTMYAIFSASFTQYLSDFVDIVIIWIAPWSAIFLVDWALRRFRYVPSDLQNTGRDSLYWRTGRHPLAGVDRGARRDVRRHLGPLRRPPVLFQGPGVAQRGHGAHARDVYGFGADFSVFLGMGVGGLVYAILAWRGVRGREADAQDALLRDEGLLPA